MIKITNTFTFGSTNYKLADSNDSVSKKICKPFVLAYKYLHSADGFDDVASAGGQICPDSAAPALTLSCLGLFTPFVIVGAAGAIHESVEHFRNDCPANLQKVLDRQTLLMANFKSIGIKNSALKLLLASHIQTKQSLTVYDAQHYAQQFLRQAKRLASKHASPIILHDIAQYEEEEPQRHISRVERDSSTLNAAAMTGMSAGMLASVATAATRSAQEAGAPIASIVPSIMGTTANAVFLPSQIGMAMYGISEFKAGKLRDKALEKDQQAIASLHHAAPQPLSDQTISSLDALIKRKRYLNKRHSICAGALLASGQAIMAGNSVAALSGAGIAATAALAPPGIALTLAGIGGHIAYEKKEEKFTGTNASAPTKKATPQPSQYIDTLITQNGIMQAIKDTEKKHADYQAALAHLKMFSLMKREIKTSEKKDDLNRPLFSRTQRQERMHAMAEHGKKDALHSTSLLRNDLAMTQNFLKEEKTFFTHPTQESRQFATTQLANAIENHPFILQHKIKENVAHKIARSVVNELIKHAKKEAAVAAFLSRQVDKETHLSDLEDFAKHNQTANDIYQKSLIKHLVQQGKTDAKFLRHDAAQKLIQLVHIAKEEQKNHPSLDFTPSYIDQRSTLPNPRTRQRTDVLHTRPAPNMTNMQIAGYRNPSFGLDA